MVLISVGMKNIYIGVSVSGEGGGLVKTKVYIEIKS